MHLLSMHRENTLRKRERERERKREREGGGDLSCNPSWVRSIMSESS